MKMQLKSLLILSLLICQIQFSKQDLPINCLYSQIYGNWRFEVTEFEEYENALENTCGHKLPDHESTSYQANPEEFQDKDYAFQILELELKKDNQVEVLNKDKCKFMKAEKDSNQIVNDKESNQNSLWTMIYNEGFEIRVNKHRIFVFSKYQKDGGTFVSDCTKTLVGWYQQEGTNKYACVRGTKIDDQGKALDEDLVEQGDRTIVVNGIVKKVEAGENQLEKAVASSKASSFLQINPKRNSQSQLGDDSRFESKSMNTLNLKLTTQFKDHQKVVDHLNTLNKSWKARVFEGFKDLTIDQLNRKAGRFKSETGSKRVKRTQRLHSKSYSQSSTLKDLPKEFSWKQHLDDAKQQGDCGSCYAIATLSMLENRLKVLHDMDVKLSVQHHVDCSYYNQGCDGGYPFLVGKFAHEVFLLEERCKTNQQGQGKCDDKLECDLDSIKQVFKVSDYWHVGGAYGECTEEAMMREIQKNGPMVASFEPSYEFMVYGEGIYSQGLEADWVKNGGSQPEWTKVDHSILIYGWGEEEIDGETIKYWLCQNSWGKEWGEQVDGKTNGYFRIQRGSDTDGIESIAEASIPVPIDVKKGDENYQKLLYWFPDNKKKERRERFAEIDNNTHNKSFVKTENTDEILEHSFNSLIR